MTVQALAMLFELKPHKAASADEFRIVDDWWWPGRQLLNEPNFLQKMLHFNKDEIPEGVMNKLSRQVLSNPDFNPEHLARISRFCSVACAWVHAIAAYYELQMGTGVKRGELAEKHQELNKLDYKHRVIREVSEELEARLGHAAPS